jgi:hypothetical protein
VLVNFDLARLSDGDVQHFLDLLAGESPFSRTIVDTLSREKERRLNGGNPVRLVLPPIADGVARRIVVNLLTAIVRNGEERSRCAGPKTREELAIGGGFISALIVALSLQAEEFRWRAVN